MNPFDDILFRAARTVLPFLWHNSVYAAVIFALAHVLTKIRPARHPSVQTGLWLLVMLRLVLPVEFSHPFSGRNLIDHFLFLENTSFSGSEADTAAPSGPTNRSTGGYLPLSSSKDVWIVPLGIWCLGIILMALLLVYRIRRYRNHFKNGKVIETGMAWEILETWRSLFKIRSRVMLVSVPQTVSPFTTGCLSPVIVIPERLIQPANQGVLESVLAHETAHIRRRDDLWIKLQNFIQILYFFNPLVWITVNRLNSVRECACDRMVLDQKRIGRVQYAEGLISIVKMQPFGPDRVALTSSFSRGRKLLLERIQNMKGEQKMRNLYKIGMIFGLISLGALILPMAAAPPDPGMPGVENPAAPEPPQAPVPPDPGIPGPENPAAPEQPQAPALKFIMPVKGGKITCGYGDSEHPITHQIRFHRAIDIHQKKGTLVLAAAEGRVVELKSRDFDSNGNGRYIILEHEGGFQTTYTQLDSILIEKDARVRQGQKIGLLGESGLSTGPHLHFELRLNGEPVNPLDYIQK